MDIHYIERKTGRLCIEKVYGAAFLTALYGEKFLQKMFSFFLLPLVARLSFLSRFYGFLQKRAASAAKIQPFMRAFGIDSSEFEKTHFHSFNDFFIRKLKKEKRPIAAKGFAAPADGRYLAFEKISKFAIKGKPFYLEDFLQDSNLAERYKEGSIAIVRLCPSDYHRFHFPCDGDATKARLINGPLYSVNPLALRKNFSILWENKREITELKSPMFGRIQYVEIGATFVGSIHQTYTPGRVQKGQEKGYFEFGGSCLVLLFEKGKILFDADLLENSSKGLETLICFGESIASAAAPGFDGP